LIHKTNLLQSLYNFLVGESALRSTVSGLDVLGLAELHQHLGGGMNDVHLVEDGGAVVRDRHLALSVLTTKKDF